MVAVVSSRPWRVDPAELLVPIPSPAARPSPDMGVIELLAFWRRGVDPRPFDWWEQCPELRLPPEAHVRLVSRYSTRSGTLIAEERLRRGSVDS